MSRPYVVLIGAVLMAVLVAGCASSQGPEGPVGPAGPPGPVGSQGPAGEAASASQTYIGSEQCGSCHEAEYAKFALSGHPYKLTKIENGQPPSFPYDDVTGGVQEPPDLQLSLELGPPLPVVLREGVSRDIPLAYRVDCDFPG